MVFAPVGFKHAMLIAGKDLVTEEKVLGTVEVFVSSRQVIERALTSMGVDANGKAVVEPQRTSATAKAEPESNGSQDIEPLLKQAKKKLKKDEVDAFWSDAVDKQKGAVAKPDVLTYDQARQMGLKLEDDQS
jgi:hypothetical protein